MTSVMITGVTGFIGKALAKALDNRGYEIHVIVRNTSDTQGLPDDWNIHIYDCSFDSLRLAMEKARPELVFHLASLFLADHKPDQIQQLVNSNILFSTYLVEAMSKTGVKYIVNTGTSWQHYETNKYMPVNLYAATKKAFEDILAYYHDACDISVITLKLFDTYGLNDKRKKLLNILIDSLDSPDVLDMSPGDQVIDLTYIDDVIDAFLEAGNLLMQRNEKIKETYFVSGERVTLKQIVEIIKKVSYKSLNVNFGGRPYRNREVMNPCLSTDNLLPNWKPKYTLSQALLKMI